MVARVIPVDPFDLVIFGGTGDLARRKILPALCRRFADGQMPEGSRIIGAARAALDTDGFRQMIREALDEFLGEDAPDTDSQSGFLEALSYVKVDAASDDGWADLRGALREDVVRAFYFSVGPSLFGPIAAQLGAFNLVTPETRIVVEKPFGHDLETARALNQTLAAHFDETQIYRIDHYLGKETVQNLMAVRFANIPCGIPGLSTMCRSPSRKASVSAGVVPITTSRARCGTWCKTT